MKMKLSEALVSSEKPASCRRPRGAMSCRRRLQWLGRLLLLTLLLLYIVNRLATA